MEHQSTCLLVNKLERTLVRAEGGCQVTLIEPGLFETKSLVVNRVDAPAHPAYGEGTYPHMLRQFLAGGAEFGGTYGNMDVFCERLCKATSIPDPPMRLPLGKGAMDAYENKIKLLKDAAEHAVAWQENIDLA